MDSPVHDTPDWHKARRNGIGGSDISAMFGLSVYKTPRELFEIKAGITKPKGGNTATRRGQDMERHVRSRTSRALGIEINEGVSFLHHPKWNDGVRLLINTDGSVVGEDAIWEGKTAREHNYVSRTFLRGKVPLDYMLQIMAYMAGTQKSKAYISCVVGPSNDLDWYDDNGAPAYEVGFLHVLEVPRNDEVIRGIELLSRRFYQAVLDGEYPSYTEHPWAIRMRRLCAGSPIKYLYKE
jgi:putative phage-type endonuclease